MPCIQRTGSTRTRSLVRSASPRYGAGSAAMSEHLTARDTLVGARAAFAATGSPGWPPYAPKAEGNSRAIGGSPADAGRMITEPPADDVTALWPTPPT